MRIPDEVHFISNMFKPQKTTDARMDGKVSVITGATSGVGYQAARRLAEGGSDLVLICRNGEKAEAVREELSRAHGIRVDVVLADFEDFAAVRNAADRLLERHPKIDVLINNAGIHRTTRTLTEEGIETVFSVNHLSSFLVTRLLVDRLVENAPARIIQVNSQGHRFGGLDLDDLNWDRRHYRGLQGYGASKVAQLLTTWELGERLNGSDVSVIAMHPGAVRTNIGMDNGLIYRWYQKYLLWPLLRGPEISGEAIYYLAAAPELQGVRGKFYNLTNEEIPMPVAQDRELGKEIWRISEELTGLPEMEPPEA